MIKKIKEKINWVRSSDLLAILAFFCLSLFFFYDLFFDGTFFTGFNRYLLSERDLAPYFIPPHFFWVESIKHGSFPLWNPYQFSGQPFFASPQHGMLYPINGLFFFLPFDIALNGVIIFHFFMAGLFTYLFLKDLKVNSTGAFISGSIFMLGGYLLSVHSLLTILLSSVWTPLIMMFFRRAIYHPGLKNELVTALLITLSFLGGGIEIVYGNLMVLLIMLIFSPISSTESIGEEPQRYKFLWRMPFYWGRFRSLALVSILFVFLSAIQLLPFLELFYHSIRGNGITYQEATIWSVAPKDALLFFLPDAYGYFLDMKKYWTVQCWFKTLYTGGLPFILSLIFFLMPRCRALSSEKPGPTQEPQNSKMLFLILMAFSIFLSLGQYNPLYPLIFKYVPFMNGIRYPAKFLYIFILVLSITAGLGFQKLSEYPKDNKKRWLKHILIIFSLIAGILLLSSVLWQKGLEHFLKLKEIDFPNFNYLPVNFHHAQRFLFYLALFFLLIRVGIEKNWKTWIKFLLVAFLIADLFGNMGYFGKEKTKDYFKKIKSLEIVSSDKENERIFSTPKTTAMDMVLLLKDLNLLNNMKEKNIPSFNLFYPLHDIWGIDVIRVKTTNGLFMAFVAAPSISTTHLLDLYGVKYITSVTPLEKDRKFKLIYANLEELHGKREDLLKQNTIKLYQNRNPLPRAWFVKNFKVISPEAMLVAMIRKEFRPGQEVFLEEEPKWEESVPLSKTDTIKVANQRRPQKVDIIFETNNRLALQANADGKCLLVLSDTYYPGWKVSVDGIPQKIYRADYAFRAVLLEAGPHRVEFVFNPISFKLGMGFTFLGIISCVVLATTYKKKNSFKKIV